MRRFRFPNSKISIKIRAAKGCMKGCLTRGGRRGLYVCRYSVDPADRIRYIGGDWEAFANENQGQALEPDRVLDRALWSYINGLENRLVYQQILTYVRTRRRVVRFLFRCDGPHVRRLVGMRVAPEADGGCSFESAILLLHRQKPLALLDARVPKTTDTIALCNWCMRADCGPLGWRPLDDRCVERGVFASAAVPRPVFTICPDCLAALRHALR